MSTAQVVNSGIVGTASRVAQARNAVASSMQFVDPLAETYAPPARDQARNFEEDAPSGDYRRRRRPATQYDQVVSFGGVLVSREVGAAIMQEQAATSKRNAAPLGAEAEHGIAIYEFNQALMGAAEVTTNVGLTR